MSCPWSQSAIHILPEEPHRALKVRAAQYGRSTEADIREILEEAVHPEARVKVRSELAARFAGLNLEPTRTHIDRAGEVRIFHHSV